jgi:hypothetical protein
MMRERELAIPADLGRGKGPGQEHGQEMDQASLSSPGLAGRGK